MSENIDPFRDLSICTLGSGVGHATERGSVRRLRGTGEEMMTTNNLPATSLGRRGKEEEKKAPEARNGQAGVKTKKKDEWKRNWYHVERCGLRRGPIYGKMLASAFCL